MECSVLAWTTLVLSSGNVVSHVLLFMCDCIINTIVLLKLYTPGNLEREDHRVMRNARVWGCGQDILGARITWYLTHLVERISVQGRQYHSTNEQRLGKLAFITGIQSLWMEHPVSLEKPQLNTVTELFYTMWEVVQAFAVSDWRSTLLHCILHSIRCCDLIRNVLFEVFA